MKKLLALLLLVSNVVCAQNIDTTTGSVQTTSNLIDPTKWGNVIYMNGGQLGQVEGAGGGPDPAFNTDTNTIRFSFMPYTVSQIIAINSVLSGQGISVGGFNYSWKIYNDLNNPSGTRGSLNVYGSLTNNSGKVLEYYNYDYSLTNTGATFQTFTGTETFKSPYQLNSLGDISMSWTGSDMNFWSGYYGPRVRDISLSLNYSVKQTSTSPTPTTTTTNTGTSSPIEIADTFSKPPPESEPNQQEQQIAYSSPPPPGSEPPPPGSTTTTTSSTSQPPPSGSSQPAPTGSQPPPGSQPSPGSSNNVASSSSAPQQGGSTSGGPSLSSILTMIKNNEKKEQAIASTAVQAANDVAQSAIQATEQTAMSVASVSSNASIQAATQQVSTTQQSNVQSSSFAQGIPLASSTQQNLGAVNNQLMMGNNASVQQNVSNNNQSTQSVDTQVSMISIQPVVTQSTSSIQTTTMTGLRSTEVENVLFTNNFLTNRANPLTEIIDNNTKTNNSSSTEQKENPLNKNAQNNELSMGISLDRMMMQPIGYNSYLQLALRDTSFYAPKEIYKNQVPSDNKRSMYFLEKGNTDTYNKMVEAQYK